MSGSRFLFSGVAYQMITASTSFACEKSVGRREPIGPFKFRDGIGGDVLDIASTLIQRFHFLGIDVESLHLHT